MPLLELRYTVTTPPAAEPVSLEEVRAHLRIDDDDDSQDVLLNLLISAARRYAEQYTGLSFLTQTIRATADHFPGLIVPVPVTSASFPADLCSPYAQTWEDTIIELKRGPIQAVTGIVYVDANGVTQTLDTSAYVFDPSGIVSRIAPAYGQAWPQVRQQLGSVQITMRAGFGDDAEDVPATIRNWLLVRIASAYEHREHEEIAARGTPLAPSYVDGLLDIERVQFI